MAIPADDTPPNALPAALRYAALRFRVLPVNQKTPILKDWTNRASDDPDTLRAWWAKRPDAGVGLRMGHQPDGSNLIAVDIDNHNPHQLGADTIADLEEAYGPLPDTPRQITGSGGAHIILRVPADVEIRNDAGRLLGPGVDIRGEGGQIVAAPTIHPNGRPYEWEDGYAPWEIPIADAPGWLVALLTPASTDGPRVHREAYVGPPRPGDQWAAETAWADLLRADQATYLATHRDGHEYWARPGLAGNDLHTSASLYYKGSDVLKVFTSGWPHLTEGETYTKLGYLAATRHGGDMQACVRHLRSLGYGQTDAYDDLLGDTLTSDPPPPGDSDPDDDAHGWEATPMAPIVAGDYQRPAPTLLRRRHP